MHTGTHTLLSGTNPCLGAGMAHGPSTAITFISWLAAVHSCHSSSIDAVILLHLVYSDICPAQYLNAWDIAGYILTNAEQDLGENFNVSGFMLVFFPVSIIGFAIILSHIRF